MLVLGLDFETQDADSKTTRVTEVGAALYTVENDVWKKECGFSHFCWEKDYPPQTQKIIDLTGITDDMLVSYGKSRKEVFESKLLPLVEKADVIFAHKIAFDRTVLYQTAKQFDLQVPEREWICTLTNFKWPKHITCHKLSHIAYEHEIYVPPSQLHRAEQDVDLMMRLLGKYKLEDVLAYARKPWIYLKADVLGPWQGKGGDGGTQLGIAKPLGFSYEQIKGTEDYRWPKTWVTRVKEQSDIEAIKDAVRISASPFRVAIIEGV